MRHIAVKHPDGAGTYNATTYWPRYEDAQSYAKAHFADANPPIRINSFGRGYALQREVSGPYWNRAKGCWN